MIYEFRHQTLVLFKALLLQKKVRRPLEIHSRLTRCLIDAVLWIPLRTNLSFSIRIGLPDTKLAEESTRLC